MKCCKIVIGKLGYYSQVTYQFKQILQHFSDCINCSSECLVRDLQKLKSVFTYS